MPRPDAPDPSVAPSPAGASGWPFAITRSVDTGFHVVVAPDFLVSCNLHHLLSDVAAGQAAEDTAYLREYRDRGNLRLWVLYKVSHLRGADVGLDSEYALHGSRRTPLVEGMVCLDRPQPPTDGLFDWVHEVCAAPVKAFFTADSDDHPVSSSAYAEPPATGTALRVAEADPYRSERNLQAALPGRRPPSARPSPPVTRAVPAGHRQDAADPGTGPGRHGRVEAGRCRDPRCAARVRRARGIAVASVALGLAAVLIVLLLCE
ncbi:hypothetical protein [Streptomyces longispororuber]|uniref:hypothetical protein n=1 Tax=Streptomyces longispororuber TaxID=68230 RepID=UPI0036FC16F8